MCTSIDFLSALNDYVTAYDAWRDALFVSLLPPKQMVVLVKHLESVGDRLDEVAKSLDGFDLLSGVSEYQIYFPYRENMLPKSPGIYFLFNRADYHLDYIGQASDLQRRIRRAHNIYNRQFHLIAYIECQDLDAIESDLIRRNSPRLNITHNRIK